MSVTTFDTLMYAKKLEAKGFTSEQAEAQVEMIKEVIDNQLATKQDINEIKRDIEDVRRDIKEAMDKIVIRLGSLLVIAVGVLAGIIKL